MVAVPTLMTAAVLMPAKMAREASGSSIKRRRAPGRQAEREGGLAQRGRDVGQARIGVADNRQQRIQEQGDNGWNWPDLMEQGDQKGQQGQ